MYWQRYSDVSTFLHGDCPGSLQPNLGESPNGVCGNSLGRDIKYDRYHSCRCLVRFTFISWGYGIDSITPLDWAARGRAPVDGRL